MSGPRPRVVLLVSGSPILGGGERSLLQLLRHLPDQGWTPVLACPEGGLAEAARDAGVRVRVTRLPSDTKMAGRSRRYSVVELLRYGRQVLGGAYRLWRLVGRERPSVVHSNSLPTHLPAVLAARARRRPVLLHLREIVKPGPGRRLLDLAGRGAAGMIAISRATAAAVTHRRVEVVLNPVQAPPGAVEPEPWPFPHPRVGFLGRLDPPKGIEDLVVAAADVPAHVVVVGSAWAGDEAYVASLQALADERAPGRVHFVGSLPDPWGALAAFDVLAVPSRWEPFGRVAAEGQLAGVPVVATDAGGLPDAITDGVDGLLVPAGDPEALAAALRKVLADPQLAAALVAAGRAGAVRFEPATHAAAVVAIYASVLAASEATHTT